MNIQSAQYIDDEGGNHTGVNITYLDAEEESQQCQVPYQGVTWQNQALDAWVAEGNAITPA